MGVESRESGVGRAHGCAPVRESFGAEVGSISRTTPERTTHHSFKKATIALVLES
ncbi:hypothetical protein H6G17_19590 [Chroococcidiopsis sp. FACHB-1243]|uniref:hypothetical protein n=1 Tax=Chroococcidiopsis sp. [FACHB-1243] TaxID=2692781 RepID=UPI0017846B88|nr:hypothetical protein [Chroococcidiopsis sp. [FACHB-1243]]MBD2307674.1 hypothetical protein [Chroococcidiopsis sp. [FACHB-1243]]